MPVSRATVASAVTAVLLLAGCGDQPGFLSASPFGSDDAYLCHDNPVPLDALEAGAPATELGADGQEALAGTEVPDLSDDELADWTVIEESDERLALIRELDSGDSAGAHPDGPPRTHRILAVERFGRQDASGRASWHLRQSAHCDLQRDLGEARPADIALDPDAPADEGDRLDLLVTERACASGEPADGRVELVDKDETDEEVRLVIGVEPREGAQECPGNPPTPFAVDLDEPLGDRTVLDASVYPLREITERP